MENVGAFIDQIIEEKGYQDLDAEVLEQLKADLTARLLDMLDRQLIQALPEDKAEELSNKLDDPNFSDEDMYNFITNEGGVNAQQVMIDTMIQFKLFYVNGEQVLNNEEQGAANNTANAVAAA
jgi:hypothetical protein